MARSKKSQAIVDGALAMDVDVYKRQRAKVRPFDASMAATSFFATVCPRRTGSPSAFTRPMSKLEMCIRDSFHDERRRDARRHGDATHARRGALVDAPGARVVDGIQTQGEPPCQRDAQIRHDEGKEAQHQEMSQSYSHAARMQPRTRGRGATR